MKRLLGLLTITILLVSCGSGHQLSSLSKQQKRQFHHQLVNRQFKIRFKVAYPQTSSSMNQVMQHLNITATGSSANAVNIGGEGYHIIVKGDRVTGILPFYGTRYSGYHPNHSKTGIAVDGQPQDYTYRYSPKKGKTLITFKMPDKRQTNEFYHFQFAIFDNGKTDLGVSSTQRSSMAYRGEVLPLSP